MTTFKVILPRRASARQGTVSYQGFQVMLDASGQVYHLDFDRCFSSSGTKWQMSADFTEACFHSLDEMGHSLKTLCLTNPDNYLDD